MILDKSGTVPVRTVTAMAAVSSFTVAMGSKR